MSRLLFCASVLTACQVIAPLPDVGGDEGGGGTTSTAAPIETCKADECKDGKPRHEDADCVCPDD